MGKTRLALELSSGLAGAFADGVYLVELAPLTAPELVAQVIARALRVRVELDRQPQSALVRFLGTRQVLLLLDNCEHLLEACATLVVPLLQGCPGLRVLATSREPLGIDGERVWRLGPLDGQTSGIQQLRILSKHSACIQPGLRFEVESGPKSVTAARIDSLRKSMWVVTREVALTFL